MELGDATTSNCLRRKTGSSRTPPVYSSKLPLATCDDGTCDFTCPDPGTCDDGICSNGEEVWDGVNCECISINVPVPCVDDGDCSNGDEVWDMTTCTCTQENVPVPCVDDGDCTNGDEVWDAATCTCTQENIPVPCVDDGDCTNGFEVWDATTCNCNITPPVSGCTNPTANNYDPVSYTHLTLPTKA